ncbi:LytR/AlgR family response regulator transcription factor [Gracilibacillus xinjiangensis]|uniref:LytR/AlgR family response regulator transcription factor n=1 Tax=Gracilibacillus xinjiangensis TaxID=1193282 RepID=A0ABV8WPY6_9BACI
MIKVVIVDEAILLSEQKHLFDTLRNLSSNREEHRELTIKAKKSTYFVRFEDIFFIEKADRKSIIHTVDGTYQTNKSLLYYERNLDNRFMLAHRSFLINLELVNQIEAIGQSNIAHFRGYKLTAKISKYKLNDVEELKRKNTYKKSSYD